MKIFLSLKHWMLFILTWAVPFWISFLSIGNPIAVVQYFPIMMVFFIGGLYGWLWSIAIVLHSRLPEGVVINKLMLHLLFLVPTVYVAYILILFLGDPGEVRPEPSGAGVALLLISHLGSMVCIFMGMRYSAKIMKSVELGRMAKFSDYAGEFFLMWFQPVGVWMIQPRLNKLVSDNA